MLVYDIYIVCKWVCTEVYIERCRSVSTSTFAEREWSAALSNFFTSTPIANLNVKELHTGCDCEDKTVATHGNRPGPPLSRQPYYWLHFTYTKLTSPISVYVTFKPETSVPLIRAIRSHVVKVTLLDRIHSSHYSWESSSQSPTTYKNLLACVEHGALVRGSATGSYPKPNESNLLSPATV